MKIQVSGFVVQSEDSNLDSEHSHILFLTSWNGRPIHRHHFAGVTSINVGHDHRYTGTTEPAPTGVPHNHRYYTVTFMNDGHKHEIRGTTGPAIPLPNGGHFHHFEGVTSVNGAHPHSHRYSGKTSPSD
jgi:hypothetical protein